MKKIISSICLTLMLFSIVACNQDKINNASVVIGESNKFNEKEVKSAIKCAKEEFLTYKGCTLKKIWYDEVTSNTYIETSSGHNSLNGVKAENIIVLLSDFDVDSSGAAEGFEPNSTTSAWSWTLIRDSKSGKWRVVDRGEG